jgi:hypothetical protein
MNLIKSFVVHYQDVKGILRDANSNLIAHIELKEGAKWREITYSSPAQLSQNYDEKGYWNICVDGWVVTDEKEIEAVGELENKCRLVFVHYIKESKWGFVQGIEFSNGNNTSSFVKDTRVIYFFFYYFISLFKS